MPITPTRSLPSQVIEVVVTETEGEEGRELEKEIAFPSLAADGPLEEPIHRLQVVTLKRVDPFTPSHARPDNRARPGQRDAGPNLAGAFRRYQ